MEHKWNPVAAAMQSSPIVAALANGALAKTTPESDTRTSPRRNETPTSTPSDSINPVTPAAITNKPITGIGAKN